MDDIEIWMTAKPNYVDFNTKVRTNMLSSDFMGTKNKTTMNITIYCGQIYFPARHGRVFALRSAHDRQNRSAHRLIFRVF